MIFFVALVNAAFEKHGEEYLKCGANIDGFEYDLTSISEALGKQEIENGKFVFRLCNPLKEEEFISQTFVRGVQAYKLNGEQIEFFGTTNSIEYKLLGDEVNPIGIQAHYYINDGEVDRHIIINLYSGSQTPFEINNIRQIDKKYLKVLSIDVYSNKILKTIKSIPENPKFDYMECLYEPEGIIDMSHKANLRDYNFHRSGYFRKINQNQELMVQPCRNVQCPYGFECDEQYASMRICDYDTYKCISYGSDPPKFDFETFQNNFTANYSSTTSKFTNFTYECDKDFQMPVFDSVHVNENSIEIHARVAGACLVPSDHKIINIIRNEHTKSLYWNEFFYESSSYVKMNDDLELYFHPFKRLNCPSNKFCDTDEPVSAWLCNGSVCESFASKDQPILFDPPLDRGIKSFQISYKSGKGQRSLRASADCWVTNNGYALLANSAKYHPEKSEITLNLNTFDACMWDWYQPAFPEEDLPPKPERISDFLYHGNSTHSVSFKASQLQLTQDTELYLLSESNIRVSGEAFLTPHSAFSCPHIDHCDYMNESSGYFCWHRDAKGTVGCHPSILSDYGYKTELIENNLESGVSVTARGAGFSKTVLNVKCADSNIKNFENREKIVEFHDPNIFELTLYTPVACVRHEVLPEMPTPLPKPTQPPESNDVKINVSVNNILIDLRKVPEAFGPAELDVGGTIEKANIYVNLSGVLDCPQDATCTSEKASVWKCWESPDDPHVCVAAADARYGFKTSGDTVELYGGFGNYKTTLHLACGPSATRFTVVDKSGSEYDRSLALTLNSSLFCVEVPMNPTKQIPPASVLFLVSLAGLSVLYLGAGAAVASCKTGRCRIPNSAFWLEFGECVVEGWRFITCRRRKIRNSEASQALLL